MAGRARRNGRAGRRPDLSQHFLKSADTARRLVALAGIGAADLVVEVGPGNGALTEPLSSAAERVIAVEADRTLYRRLFDRFPVTSNVALRSGDFLKFRLPKGPYTFFANIPFSKTAAILRKLALGDAPPLSAHIIMESVAATRFLGRPFGAESALSLMTKARFDVSISAWLGPESFSPSPTVNSVMLKLEARSTFSAPGLRRFDTFARAVFANHGRSVRPFLRKLLPRPQLRSLTTELGFPADESPSNISFNHWLTLFNLVEWNRKR